MKKTDENGFITMIVVLLAILVTAIAFVFLRIKNAQG